MKRVAILQSNYIPWKGYFDLIASVDEFIIYDDMQFTKNDWRNRNLMKTPLGTQWLSIPVGTDINRRIRDVAVNDRWQVKHWKSLESNYRRSPYFQEIAKWLKPLYLDGCYTHLSQVNRTFIEAVCKFLGIATKITNSWDYPASEGKSERLVDLCISAGADQYISGPAAKEYLDAGLFCSNGIRLEWFDYLDYPVYPQLWGGFEHKVTTLDLLFNCGNSAPQFMKYVNKR